MACIVSHRQKDAEAFSHGSVRRLFKPNFDQVLEKGLVHVRNGCLSDFGSIHLYEAVPGSFWEPAPGYRFQVWFSPHQDQ